MVHRDKLVALEGLALVVSRLVPPDRSGVGSLMLQHFLAIIWQFQVVVDKALVKLIQLVVARDWLVLLQQVLGYPFGLKRLFFS